MRNLDEILADAKGKNVDRFQPHAHDTRTAVEPVAEIPQPKAAPSVKEHKARKISTRGLLLLLVLGVAGVGSVSAFAASTGVLTVDSNSESLQFVSYVGNSNLTLHNSGSSIITLIRYETIAQGTQVHYFNPKVIIPTGADVMVQIAIGHDVQEAITTERGHIFTFDLTYN